MKIKGMDEFLSDIKRAPDEAGRELSKAVNKSIVEIASRAKKEAPANKGISTGNTLRQNIKERMVGQLRGEVVADRPYAIYVHQGTRPHIIVPIRRKVLANKRTGEFFGKRVRHPGTKPNPFFERAFERSSAGIEKFFNTAMDNLLKFLAK